MSIHSNLTRAVFCLICFFSSIGVASDVTLSLCCGVYKDRGGGGFADALGSLVESLHHAS